jgi:hypothetical protein
MILFLILVFFLILGIVLNFFDNNDLELLSIPIIALSILLLFFHTLSWLTVNYRYEMHIVKRNSFIESLQIARSNKNSIELAAISKDIIEYNKDLAVKKFENQGLLDCYIDDRFMDLKPIR